MSDIGCQIFNEKGELFYDNDYSDSVMTLTEKRVISFSGAVRAIDLGVPSNRPCVLFFKTTNITCNGSQYMEGGRWKATFSSSANNTLTLYIFSNLPSPNPSPKQYGIELYDSVGNVIIHNNSKPLVCQAVLRTRDDPPISYSFEPACTGAFIGIRSGGPSGVDFVLHFTTAVGVQLTTSQVHVQTSSPSGVANMHFSVLVIDSSQYD